MGETSKIVTEHYPAEKLPEELRPGIEAGLVKVTVETEDAVERAQRRSFLSFFGSAPGLYATPEDAVAFIRALRDESDR